MKLLQVIIRIWTNKTSEVSHEKIIGDECYQMYYRSNNLLIFFSTNSHTEFYMLYHDFKRWETSIYTTLWGFWILNSAWRTAFLGDSITGECISATPFKLTIDHYRVSTVRSPLLRHRNPGTISKVSVLLKSLTQTVRHRIQKE